MKTRVPFLFLLLLFLHTLPAQETMEEIASRARSVNLEIIKAKRALREAEENLKGEISLKESVFSLEGGYRYLSPAAAAAYPSLDSGFSGSLGITLPFVPQAALGGEVEVFEDGDFVESISLSLMPFLKKDPLYPEEEEYGKALVQLKYLYQSIFNNTERAVLNIMITEMEQELAKRTLELEQAIYDLTEEQLEQGDASFQDLQTQLVDLNEAQEELYNTEFQLLQDRRTLALLLGSEKLETSIQPLTLEELQEKIDPRSREISSFAGLAPSSEKLEILTVEQNALKAEKAATPRWQPDTEATATAALPDFAFSIEFNLSFSPAELKNEELEDLENDIFEKQLDIRAELFNIDLQKKLLEQSIAISRHALASSLLQRDKDTIALQETELLFQKGSRTSLELEQMRLNLRRSEIQSFKSAAGLYIAQSDFFMLFLK